MGVVRSTLVRLMVTGMASMSAVLAVPSTAQADLSDEQELAERYAPGLRLAHEYVDGGPDEPFLPSDVDGVLGNPSVALRGPWESDEIIKIAPTAEDLSRGLLPSTTWTSLATRSSPDVTTRSGHAR